MAIDLEAIRKKMNQLNGKRGSNVQLWKPQEVGQYRIRVLPWPANITADGTPFVERYFYYIGDNSGVLSTKQFGEEDPVDEVVSSLFRSGKEGDREIAKKLMPKMRSYLSILVKGEESKGVQVFSFNRFIYQRILGFFLNEEIGDITDIKEGFDLIVDVVDSGRKWNGRPVYDQSIDAARKPTALVSWFDGDVDKMNEALENLPNIDDMYSNARKTPDELKTILDKWLSGDDDDNDKDDDEGTTRGPKSNELDKLVEDVNKSNDADDTEEEKPKARKRRVKKEDVNLDADSDNDNVEASDETKKSLDEAFDDLMT